MARAFVVAVIALAAVGCGESRRVAEVDGVLRVKGQPAHKMHIEFVPDVAKGTNGPISIAETDADGRFTMHINDAEGSSRTGAVVGWHRVVLSDMQLAESATGRGVPIRVPPEYTLPGSTPLLQEVVEGKQTIELSIP